MITITPGACALRVNASLTKLEIATCFVAYGAERVLMGKGERNYLV